MRLKDVLNDYSWNYEGVQYSTLCCVACCDYRPATVTVNESGEHRFMSMHGRPSCLWCELCGHVYAGRCDEHRS